MSDDGGTGGHGTGEEVTAGTEQLSPEAAFSLLGDATRVDVLRALAATEEPLSFSTLREEVGVADSGGFNYHLGKLVDRFVRKTDDGYELTTAGTLVHAAIISGAYTESAPFDPIPLDAEADACPECRAPLELRYVDERLRVACPACDRLVADAAVPPGAIRGRPREAIPDAFGQYLRTTVVEVTAGFCPLCSGPVAERLELSTVPSFDIDRELPLARFECEQCGERMRASPGAVLLDHPDLVAFYRDHGRDVREVPAWRLPLLGYESTDVVATDPMEVAVSVTLDDERLTVTLDADLDVVGSERTSR